MEEEKADNFLRRKVNFWRRRRKTVKETRKTFGEGEVFLWRKEKEKEKKNRRGREGEKYLEKENISFGMEKKSGEGKGRKYHGEGKIADGY